MIKTKLNRFLKYEKTLAFILIIGISAVGTFLLVNTRAATPTAAFETELGSIISPAKILDNIPSASNSKGVLFANNSVANPVSSDNPCVGNSAPSAGWKHIVVLMFENKTYNSVIGSASAPYISSLANKCGSYTAWKDANLKVNGTVDGSYSSKPNYATLTSGVPPSVHGMIDNTFTTTSSVDNIFNRLKNIGKSAKVYQNGVANSCNKSNFSGSYHDPLRYYTNLGGQSADTTTYCNKNDIPLSNFMTDVNNGNLPAYSMIIPTNNENMHDNSISSGDSWAQAFLVPLLDSAQYKSGDTAVFFLWDEDTPIPNVLIAPSIDSGSKPAIPGAGSNPIGHYSALRTWQEMLGVSPFLGDSGQAPSLLSYFNGSL